MDYDFARQYMNPKRTGNAIRDLNPMSKVNLMLVLGLSPFIVQNYFYGFGMVLSVRSFLYTGRYCFCSGCSCLW